MTLRSLFIILMLPMAALAQTSKSLPELDTATAATADDLLMIYDYGAVGTKTRHITAANLRTYIGGGTVTSVSLTAPDIFTVTGSGGTTAVSLVIAPTDPGADRLVFWDDSAGKWVYLTVGAGLLITGTTLGFDINGLTADGSPDVAADYVITYDASAGTVKKVLLSNLPGGGGGSVATDVIWDAKGDLAVGTGANTSAKLPVGADATLLVADALEATGIKWAAITTYEAALEAVIDLQDLQGAVTDAQVPNNITVDNATAAGTATLASTVTVVDGTDATSFPLIVDSATGSLAPKTDAGLTYDASTGKLTATSLASGGAGIGFLRLGDTDDSHGFSLGANGTTTTDVHHIGPAAPFAGYVQYSVSAVTNWIPSQIAFGVGLLGSDGSNVPVDVDTIAEFSTTLGITGTPNSGTYLRGDGAWSSVAGSGDVSKVGTPVDNQIGVWTGDGTIEGDTAFTWDTSTDTLTFAASANILFGAVTILDDNAGTMTLSNIDALDATTIATIDAALGIADVDDTAVAASWNANLDASTKNALHDYFALMDSDLDGLVNALDATFTFSGFSISGDGDGAITLLGAGDGSDEDLTINLDDTANNAIITTSTGLTNITLTAINLTVPAAAYDATAWNGNNAAPTRDDVRDKIELLNVGTIGITIDGGGSAITTGIKGFIEIPYACTITQMTMLADQSGSCVVDIWKDTYANYPPTDADTITAAAVPTISAATKSQDATLTGWTTSVTAGDIIGFNVDSASTITRLTITLKTTR